MALKNLHNNVVDEVNNPLIMYVLLGPQATKVNSSDLSFNNRTNQTKLCLFNETLWCQHAIEVYFLNNSTNYQLFLVLSIDTFLELYQSLLKSLVVEIPLSLSSTLIHCLHPCIPYISYNANSSV